ncbi:MAG: flagellar hook capping protein [Thermoanaerobacteraceae bacterium]|nr:flagellar hook capping protein [Thermoanaerobacteraceae bacterium]
MAVSAASNATNGIYYDPQAKYQPPKQELDKDAFLQILVAQMRYQNPLSPMDGNQFMAQMAQMTTMEQMVNLSKNMELLLRTQELSLSASLVGQQVTVVNGEGQDVTGRVEKISIDEKGIKVVVDGVAYDYDRVKEILGR